MSSVQHLREFISQRLTAAAEEILSEFEKTIVQYEEEIDRQRGLLDISWKPQIKLHTADLPLQHICRKEEVLADPQFCIQGRNSSLDQEEPEPPQIKEEWKELCTNQEEEQLVLKQETDNFMLTQGYEESDFAEPEQNTDQLLSHNSPFTVSQSQEEGTQMNSESSRNAEMKPKKRHNRNRSHSDNVNTTPKTPKRGRPSSNPDATGSPLNAGKRPSPGDGSPNCPSSKKACTHPPQDVRKDQTGHFPMKVKRGRCRHCSKGYTNTQCSKCDVRLCFSEDKNCFWDYHCT
ncbi:uncharacterized protein LOC142398556 [Odontesthes bonariensis]|uniref:uncharacterized protein LOC142398556 n=1 Tax=Odontesthes bonariensis TaxID=219752 RepID=UPI003F58C25B